MTKKGNGQEESKRILFRVTHGRPRKQVFSNCHVTLTYFK